MKKFISVILAIVLLISVFSMTSLAGADYEYRTWKQNDVRWADFKIGMTETVKGGGCAIVAVAMAMVHSGAVSTDPAVFNPLVIAQWMKSNGGFTQSEDYYSDGLIYWSKAAEYTNNFSYLGDYSLSGTNEQKTQIISEYIQQGYVVIVDTGWHYVLVDTVTKSDVLIIDPAWSWYLSGSLFDDYSSADSVQLYKGPVANIDQNENEPENFYGDIDCDNDVTATDSLIVLNASIKSITLSEEQIVVADVDSDKEITATDSLLILYHSINAISKFPAEK